jgi:RNA polymerase-binding protein DksA
MAKSGKSKSGKTSSAKKGQAGTKEKAAKQAKVAKKVVAKKPAKKTAPIKKAAKPAPKAKQPVAKQPVKKAQKPAAKAIAKPVAKAPVKPTVKPVAKVASSQPTSAKKNVAVVAAPLKNGTKVPAAATLNPGTRNTKTGTLPKTIVPPSNHKMIKVEKSNGKSVSSSAKNGATNGSKNAPPMRLSVNDSDVIASAKAHYGAKDLENFKRIIHEQRAEASEEFDIISEQMLDTSGEFDADNQSYALHTAEQGTDAMEREKTFLHAQRTSDYIKKLDEALERIDRGTYGICVICGELIERGRLEAVPITQKHVDCKNKTQAKKLTADQPYQEAEEVV